MKNSLIALTLIISSLSLPAIAKDNKPTETVKKCVLLIFCTKTPKAKWVWVDMDSTECAAKGYRVSRVNPNRCRVPANSKYTK